MNCANKSRLAGTPMPGPTPGTLYAGSNKLRLAPVRLLSSPLVVGNDGCTPKAAGTTMAGGGFGGAPAGGGGGTIGTGISGWGRWSGKSRERCVLAVALSVRASFQDILWGCIRINSYKAKKRKHTSPHNPAGY